MTSPSRPASERARSRRPESRGCALVITIDAQAGDQLAAWASQLGYFAITCGTLHQAQVQLALQPASLLVLDTRLPEDGALALLADDRLPAGCPIVLLAAASAAGLPGLEQAAGHRALARLPWPADGSAWHQAIQRLGLGLEPDAAAVALEAGAALPIPMSMSMSMPFVGQSTALRRVIAHIARVAATPLPVFIWGESGTGKELVARSLHEHSPRARQPFVAVNCAAISPQLFESEVFGHEPGSFTGAQERHAGFFEQAEGGTLFLDEVTEMPTHQQAKLLRVIESNSFMRVGGSAELACDVRIVSASNRDPAQALAEGLLREDLYYRLAVFPIRTPALRERPEDIPALATHFLRECGPREGHMLSLAPQAMLALQQRAWPGNVRQLRSAIQRAWVMASSPQIDEAGIAAAP